jgi:polysaccharide chain length determinant protein (PEP-CTERM system associated)
MDLQEYGALFLRKKWAIVFSVLSILFAASVYFVLTPKLYKSSITILIIPQTVPQDYVRSTISFKVEQQLATIKQQVTSRTTLTKMMDELNLFEKERKKLSSEEMFALVRKRIGIEVVQGQGRDSSDAFSLSFLHEDPRSAMRATARLASLFIGENLRTREQQAVGTSEFLESQLKDTKARLEVMEQRIKDYKMRYMGELPQQMEANLRMLAGLQDRLRTNETSARIAEERKVFLEAQISFFAKSNSAGDPGKAGASADPVQSLGNDLSVAKARLADLSTRYTDRVPEVVRARRDVEELEQRYAAAQRSASSLAAGDPGTEPVTPALTSASAFEEVRRMKAQLKAVTAEIQSLKKERDEVRKGIASVERKVEQSPRREQEMISLIRDYENQKKSYDDLLKKKLEADVSQNLEKRQKGTQFQILDPANLPEKPFQPDRKKVFGVSFLLALALGFGGTIAWESMDMRLRSVRDFRHHYKVPILGYIPEYRDHGVQRAQAVRRAVLYGGLITITTVFSLLLLAYRDEIRNILNF